MINRRRTKEIRVGNVKIGGSASIAIQSMTNTETADINSTIDQIKLLEGAGCEIIRVAVKTLDDAEAIGTIKKKIRIPLVSDIHFNYKLALEAIRNGADKIRLNPGNIGRRDEIAAVIKAAKKAKIPIRIGVNSGSVFSNPQPTNPNSKNVSRALVNAALKYINVFEELDFHDIIVSLKASDVAATVEAYRRMAGLCSYPLHLGVTATGPYDSGIVKSSIGIGSLLLDGIGDTIRVSLTADPVREVEAAKRILSALNIRRFGPEVISCPTCGRCQVDLINIVSELENGIRNKKYGTRNKALTVALMGCEVNGPGEAREADIGIAFGKKSGMLFKRGKTIRKILAKDAVKEILKELL